MASTSEVGNKKNIAHLATLITYCVSYGTSYNPSAIAIKLPQLNTLATNAQTAENNVTTDEAAETSAGNARVVAFQNIKKLATRLLAAVSASGATSQQKANAKTITRKIRGSRAKITPVPAPTPAPSPTPTPNPTGSSPTPAPSSQKQATTTTTPHTISTAQVSFDNLIQHMQAFIALLATIPSYNPNEIDLKIASLNTYVANLNTTNNAAVAAHTTASNTRIARNKILYTPITGLCDIGEETKDYIKSVYGATAPEYKQVRKLSFTKKRL